ncbi:NmrA family NAD(P)-binding protein [Dactylosporangium sp. NPDC049525]|uniref:NmrA family NAD(P)-binding protein n=1 Tax=Dactylosporangium sp. NPDC049525 TaxID=3154730 RepID=UPI003427A7E9
MTTVLVVGAIGKQGGAVAELLLRHGHDVAAYVHLVYSSVRGAGRMVETDIAHADSKQLVEAYLRAREVRATVLGPVYFMENVLNVGFSRLTDGVLANPLSAGKPLGPHGRLGPRPAQPDAGVSPV